MLFITEFSWKLCNFVSVIPVLNMAFNLLGVYCPSETFADSELFFVSFFSTRPLYVFGKKIIIMTAFVFVIIWLYSCLSEYAPDVIDTRLMRSSNVYTLSEINYDDLFNILMNLEANYILIDQFFWCLMIDLIVLLLRYAQVYNDLEKHHQTRARKAHCSQSHLHGHVRNNFVM